MLEFTIKIRVDEDTPYPFSDAEVALDEIIKTIQKMQEEGKEYMKATSPEQHRVGEHDYWEYEFVSKVVDKPFSSRYYEIDNADDPEIYQKMLHKIVLTNLLNEVELVSAMNKFGEDAYEQVKKAGLVNKLRKDWGLNV